MNLPLLGEGDSLPVSVGDVMVLLTADVLFGIVRVNEVGLAIFICTSTADNGLQDWYVPNGKPIEGDPLKWTHGSERVSVVRLDARLLMEKSCSTSPGPLISCDVDFECRVA